MLQGVHMIKFLFLILLFLGIGQAEEFNTKYLSCTLVKIVDGSSTKQVTERSAKSQKEFEVNIVVTETKFITNRSKYRYTRTNDEGYDEFLGPDPYSSLNIYYKNDVGYATVSNINGYHHARYYNCKKRNPTLREKAEALKNSWF